ncbi:MAG TPA: NAD-dependent epimerase/dehydratase family protein [Longimicrobiales bacterium]|nr:NAD-dependent epimerase/dehydratase family protein [Longimicrobiales bacterium]
MAAAHTGGKLSRTGQGIAFSWLGAHLRGCLETHTLQVLVTGATGFVGSHFVEALARSGSRVRALVRASSRTDTLRRTGAEIVCGTLDDPALLRHAVDGVDVVYHLAALTKARTADEYRRVNVEGSRALVEAAAAASARRFVYLSSLAAVGPSYDGRPVSTADVPRPLTQYGRTKLAGEEACRAFADTLEVVVLRAAAVYGPRDRDLYRFFSMAARGVLAIPGGPDRPTQLVHVHDLVDALVRAGSAPSPTEGVYHVAEARAYPSVEVARLIAQAVGRPVRLLRVPPRMLSAAAAVSELGAGLVGRATIFNRDKARELLAPGWLCETLAAERDLGFVARTALPEGLKETAAWYRASGWL